MPENKDYMIHREELGSIQISEDVVATIAAGAAMDVENVTGLQGTNVTDFMGDHPFKFLIVHHIQQPFGNAHEGIVFTPAGSECVGNM